MPASHNRRGAPAPLELREADAAFEAGSVADPVGRVFYWNDRVFRQIKDPRVWERYRELLGDPAARALFDRGLVETWIAPDVRFEGCAGVLEHRRIDFVSTAPEWTSDMLWDAAKAIVDVAAGLARLGFGLKDGHPWNVLFDFTAPKLVDFGSIVPELTSRWLAEFRVRFVAPLCLLHHRATSAAGRELLFEHHHGLGRLFLEKGLGAAFPLSMGPARIAHRLALGSMDRSRVVAALEQLSRYLERLEPAHRKERWANYTQDPSGETSGQQRKTDAVAAALDRYAPRTVLDMGTNKGRYAFMAAERGAAVAAFDYEEYNANHVYGVAKARGLRVLPAVMDFRLPTPPSGVALTARSAFDRYRSDLTLVLGMVHHLALHQELRFAQIAEIVSRYTKTASVVEFVHPDDQHITSWRIPADYSMGSFVAEMARTKLRLVGETKALPTRSILVFESTP
jgi:hypothetical protein